jgi:transposase InsO family protein
VTDAELKEQIERVYEDNYEVYGAEKVWWQLHRDGIACGRDRVARLMRALGIFGVTRTKSTRTTVPAKKNQPLPADLVRRNFKATEPNRLWVNDLTYVPIWSGFAYTAFVIDAFSQRIVGWKVSTSLETGLALDALEMAIWSRRGESLEGLVHHSDRGGQYLAIRYTARLDEAGVASSVGSKGDSYDKALVSYCTSWRCLGGSSLGEAGSHLFDEARVAGCGRLEEPDVLVVGLVGDEQAGAVPGLDGRGVHAETVGEFGDGEQPFGSEPFEVAGQVVAAA